MQKLIFTAVAAGLVVLSGCKKDEESEFDRKAMLENMASAVIIPHFETLNNSLSLLGSEAADFVSDPNSTTLAQLRTQYMTTCADYQYCSMYNFGPFMDYGIKSAFNTFPTDTAKIEANIVSGSYTLGSSANITAIGFPALDYLLYSGSDAEIVAAFSTGTLAANRRDYLSDLVAKMKSEFQPVVDLWNSSYKTTFVSADGNDVASSCSYLLNEFVKDIELLKNARIGIPSGQQTGGMTLPDYVEACYSGYSISFARNQLYGLMTAFTGSNGLGFDDYIRDVEGEEVTVSLADQILDQFEICLDKLNALGEPLSAQVDTNPSGVYDLYLEIKKLVVYCKTDMTSRLGILITYQDNDGD